MKGCWRSIGIAGSIRGSGVTHLSVALANYAAGGLGEKTAYLEINGHGELAHWKEADSNGYFTDHKIHYYPNVKKEQIPILLNCEYETLIMDFGDAYINFREELLRCDRKVFLLNLNPWQMFDAKRMIEAVRNDKWGGIHPLYAGVNTQKMLRNAVEKEYHIKIKEIPYIPNPRCIQEESFSCMDFILGRLEAETKRKKSRIPIFKRM